MYEDVEQLDEEIDLVARMLVDAEMPGMAELQQKVQRLALELMGN